MPKKIEKKYSISEELKERTYKFALGILELASLLPNNEEGRVIRRQLCKSGTSVGSNLEEADGSLTLNDFVHKVDIAFKEGKETRYWLRIIIARKLLKKEIVLLHLDESVELIKILSTIIYKCLR
ncbi:MAG: four helix bundle protein [candidate division WOR-3 bacterium]